MLSHYETICWKILKETNLSKQWIYLADNHMLSYFKCLKGEQMHYKQLETRW